MESKSIVIHKGGKEEKYKLCVEDYVLSYLKYETGSLEFSEIYFYGIRQNEDKKYIIYGAGRDKHIPVFDAYDLLEEVICRLTQAGPVFMVREAEEVYQIKGFDIFYQDNEAMQSYMVERQRNYVRPKAAEQTDRHVKSASPSMIGMDQMETKPLRSHGIMSAQLGVILIILVAIVINSANSYDKMKQLNQSAEEVFFAIENQEADESVSKVYDPNEEIVVERDTKQADGQDNGQDSEDSLNMEDDTKPDNQQTESVEKADVQYEEENLQTVDEADINKPDEKDNFMAEQKEDDGEQTEALSRNVTRYYEVENGDTLYTICQKIYGDISQVEKICELNDISDPDRIRSGQKIILP